MPDEQEIFGASPDWLDLQGRASLRKEIDSVLTSVANLENFYAQDLLGKADLFRRSWCDISSEGDTFRRSWPDLGTGAWLFKVWQDLKSDANIEAAFPPPIPVTEILAIHDKRSFTPKEPNIRLNWIVTVPAASENVYSSFHLNANIEQIVLDIPDLDGGTLKLQLLDEIGTILYESGAQSENSKVALLLTADTRIPLVGQPTVKLLLSPVPRATDSIIRVFLYGR